MYENAHVNAVSVFKGHEDDQSIPEDHIRCLFLFQVTTRKTNTTKVLEKTSKTRLVDHIVEHRVSLNNQIYLSELVEYALNHTRLFTSSLTSKELAEQIISNILSRFKFSSITPSFISILFAVNIDRILIHYQNSMSSSTGGDRGGSSDDNEALDMDIDEECDTYGVKKDLFSDILRDYREVTGLVDVELFDSTDCCSICLEEYGSDCSEVVMAASSDCSHVFHRDCICPWLRKSSECPLCRSVFIAEI